MARSTNTCTKRIYPPGMAGIGSAHNCGNPMKERNEAGEPRCGVHSKAAEERQRAKKEAAEKAEQERAERWRKASYRNALSGITEQEARALFILLTSSTIAPAVAPLGLARVAERLAAVST